ncbi:MAG: hypothetical protein LDLANPLL_01319 [Turneriella sp.]|nr:hypothetical protein [Turneriella sp.]
MKAILNFKKGVWQKPHRVILAASVLFFIFTVRLGGQTTKVETLVLSGPPASVSFPLAYAVASGALKNVAEHVEFKLWMTPDQLRSLALDKKTAIMAMPSNVAANLYNKNIAVKPLNISTWGILYMLSRDKNRTRLADFRGEEIVIPFRGDMPDIVFQILAKKQGLNIQKDFKIRYVTTPLDAMQLLLTRRVRHVILPEPAVSMALRKSGAYPIKLIAPDLFRSMSFQEEWARVFKRKDIMPQAGIVAVGDWANNKALSKRVTDAYSQALKKCMENIAVCSYAIAPYFGYLTPEAIYDALKTSKLDAVDIRASEAELKYFFQKLYEENPALLGGKMPAEDFYR